MQPPHPWSVCSTSKSGGTGDAVDENGAAERQEEILQCLSKLTQLRLSEKSLAADFRLQLQLLECSVQQQRLLQQLADQQRRTAANLEGLHGQGTSCNELVQQRLEHVQQQLEHVCRHLDHQQAYGAIRSNNEGKGSMAGTQPLSMPLTPTQAETPTVSKLEAVMSEAVFAVEDSNSVPQAANTNGAEVTRHMPRYRPKAGSWCNSLSTPCSWLLPSALSTAVRSNTPVREVMESAQSPAATQTSPSSPRSPSQQDGMRRCASRALSTISERTSGTGSQGLERRKSRVSLHEFEQLSELERKHAERGICWRELPPTHPLRRMVSSTVFDLICAVVISCNAATIGLHTQESIEYAIKNIGSAEKDPEPWLRNVENFYVFFYITELCIKLLVFRLYFFTNKDMKWNLFDLLLVVVGIYDLVGPSSKAEGEGSKDVNVTWIRLLRLIRMLKMLRVVRVMRFFRVLRMMATSIAGSMMTLLWSILMLSLMMYIFGLCFLQIISGFLADTKDRPLEEATLEAIKLYWNNVPQAIITLYYAVTGGADWEILAVPIREAGEYYFFLFLFYIAFTAFAVLNVLTGLYVDNATKISEMDNESVEEELDVHRRTKAFKDFIVEKEGHPEGLHQRPILRWSTLEANQDEDEVLDFLGIADLESVEECRKTFDRLDTDITGKVELDIFVNGILESQVPSMKLEMMSLASETKGCSDQQIELLTIFQNCFDELFRRIPSSASEAGHHRVACLPSPPGNDGTGSNTSCGVVSECGTTTCTHLPDPPAASACSLVG